MRSWLSLVFCTLVLAACDSEGPDPIACFIGERADTVAVLVGDTMRVDLDAFFPEATGPLTYALDEPASPGVTLEGDRGQTLVVHPTATGMDVVTLAVTGRCGLVGSIRIVVGASASCTAEPPTSVTPPPVRLAVGGLGTRLDLFGEDGPFRGTFPVVPVVTITSVEGDFTAVTFRRELSLFPDQAGTGGTGSVGVRTTDVCDRPIEAEVPVEVVVSPTCSPDYDPNSVNYFPLAVGTRWRYAARYYHCSPPPGTCSESFGEEDWEVVSEGTCASGQRSYVIRRTSTVGAHPAIELRVAGDTLRGLSLYGGGSPFRPIRQRYPPVPTPPDSISGTGTFGSSYRLRRGVGPSYLHHYIWGGHGGGDRSTTLTLLEGFTPPRPQNGTAAWRR